MLFYVHSFLLHCLGFSATFSYKLVGLAIIRFFKESSALKFTRTLQDVSLGTVLSLWIFWALSKSKIQISCSSANLDDYYLSFRSGI